MYRKCTYCGRFYNKGKEEKMCQECKSQFESAFEKMRNNKKLHNLMQSLANQ